MKTQIFITGDHVSVVTDCTTEIDFLLTFTRALEGIVTSPAILLSGFNVLARFRGYKSDQVLDRTTLSGGPWPDPDSQPVGEGEL